VRKFRTAGIGDRGDGGFVTGDLAVGGGGLEKRAKGGVDEWGLGGLFF